MPAITDVNEMTKWIGEHLRDLVPEVEWRTKAELAVEINRSRRCSPIHLVISLTSVIAGIIDSSSD